MSDNTELTEPWKGDINEAVIEEWKEDTTAFDRITTVIDATAEPAFAREIAERAAVAEPTARRHLKSLAEVGRVTAVSADGGTKYKRSPSTLAMRRISGLHATYSKAELQDAIADLREKLAALRDEHGVSDADDLATELELGDDDWTDISRWRELEENLDIAKAALNLYDFDPDGSGKAIAESAGSASETDDRSAVGSLAGFGEWGTA
jgi:DNA-binding transcriptional ArsR family regulator